jgi:hypothetical protein
MANPITSATIVSTLDTLRTLAIKAGLMTEDQKLIYESGVAAGGVPPAVWLDQRGTDVPFLPKFEVINRWEQYRTIQGAIYALMAVNNRP